MTRDPDGYCEACDTCIHSLWRGVTFPVFAGCDIDDCVPTEVTA